MAENNGVNDYEKALMQEEEKFEVPNLANISGTHSINMSLLSYSGGYYMKGIEIFVKPFTTKEVVYFTSVNDENPVEIDQAMRYLIDACVVVKVNGKKVNKPSNYIYNHDRLPLILIARIYSDMKTDLTFSHKCTNGSCDHEQTMKIIPQNIVWSDDSKLKKYFNKETGNFDIEIKSLDGGKRSYQYRPLSISENNKLFNFMVEKRDELDNTQLKVFLRFFPYMRNLFDGGDMVSCFEKFIELTKTQVTEISLLESKLSLGATNKISKKCTSCGHVGDVLMKFPNGIGTIVVDSVEIDDFLL